MARKDRAARTAEAQRLVDALSSDQPITITEAGETQEGSAIPEGDFYYWYDQWLASEPHWLDGAEYVGEVDGRPQHLLGLDAWDAMTRYVRTQEAPLSIILTCQGMGTGAA
jgi:hypothetical protein